MSVTDQILKKKNLRKAIRAELKKETNYEKRKKLHQELLQISIKN